MMSAAPATSGNERAKGWIYGAINPLLRALETERTRLSLDRDIHEAGDIGFRRNEKTLRYVRHFSAYLTWEGQQLLDDLLSVNTDEAKPFRAAQANHDEGIDALKGACDVAFARLCSNPALRRKLSAAWGKPGNDELFQLAVERLINDFRNIGALVETSERWGPAFEDALAVAQKTREYKNLVQARDDCTRRNLDVAARLNGVRRQLASKHDLPVAPIPEW